MIGKVVKDFFRSSENMRNSEGAFIDLDNNCIAFAYSRYRNIGTGDGATCDLAVCFSYDGGESFGKERVFLTCEECNALNIMSVSLLRMNDGNIGVFYIKKTSGFQANYCYRKTKDFITLSEEMECIKERGFSVINNDRVVRLSSGRIIIPSAYLDTKNLQGVTHENYKEDKVQPAVARFHVSDDDGKTFSLISQTEMPHKIFTTGLQEPGIIELEPKKLLSFYRNNSGRQYISYSFDDGKTWTVPEPSRFMSPISPMSIKKLRDGKILAIYNPIPLYFGRSELVDGHWTGARTPFVMSICRNDINEEEKLILIEDDPRRGYCYCAIHETEDGILLGYSAGGPEDGCTLTKLRIRKIYKSEL